MNTRDKLANLWRELPLVGGLVDCTAGDHWNTVKQTAVLLVLSSMPFWLGAVIIYSIARVDNSGALFSAALYKTVSHGELLMYSTALLSPIFWLALAEFPSARRFPGQLSHVVLMFVVSILAAGLFGVETSGGKLDESTVYIFSKDIAWVSLALLYLGTVYHESRISPAAQELKRQEDAFSDAVSEHRK